MKNPLVKLAVAAVVVIVCVVGVSLWRTTSSGIALADVLAQVQQSTAYMYQMTMTISGKGPSGLDMNQTVEGTMLIAQDYGMRMTMDRPDPNGGEAEPVEIYVLLDEKAMIMLMPATKQYMRAEFDDTRIEKTRQENYDPGAMLKQILDCKYESLGRSTIDGVDVEGFQTTDPNYLAAMAGQVDVKIWVDVKTQLPVREEMDMQMGDMRTHSLVHSFQWDYPVDAAAFKPAIPADYTTLLGGTIKMPAMNEQSAIAGLKLCADLTGRYPEKLDFMTVASLLSKLEKDESPALDLSLEGDKGLSQGERIEQLREQVKKAEEQLQKRKEQVENMEGRIKETMDKVLPIQGTVTFYMMLIQEKKDPAYYGSVVTPQDADKVLMRWKVSDNEYRVIYADLHAETVTPAKLAELEKTLPR